MKTRHAVLVCLLATSVGLAQTQRTALKCGRLIHGRSEKPLEHVSVLVEENTITSVGSDVVLPSDARVIDLSTETVLPGLIA